MKSIRDGRRLIAKVNQDGVLNRDPHYIDDIPQTAAHGFNSLWQDWNDINKMMDICEWYLYGDKYRLVTLTYYAHN